MIMKALLLGLAFSTGLLLRATISSGDGAGMVQTSGRQIAIVYVGADGCAWSTKEGLAESVRNIRAAVNERVQAAGASVVMVGVARDFDLDIAIDHLRNTAQFDELLVGANWQNEGVQRYMGRDFPGPMSTPQVVVIECTADLMGGSTLVSQQRLVMRKVGYHQIMRWAARGYPLPDPYGVGTVPASANDSTQ